MNPRSPTSLPDGGTGYPSKRARHHSPDSGDGGGIGIGAGTTTTTTTATPAGAASKGAASPTSVEEDIAPPAVSNGAGPPGGKAGQSSSFRNVSACNRCRLRKNRCDQRLPSCASCEKASVKCVGYDPITKREIPRR
jgi:hypothetical protein